MSDGWKSAVAVQEDAGPKSENSRLTEHLWTEWENTCEELSELAQEEDRLVSEGLEVPEDLEQQIDEAYALQRKILLDALSIRSESLRDLHLKLGIWQSHTFGDKVKPHLMQPSDLLIRQTIRELGELLK